MFNFKNSEDDVPFEVMRYGRVDSVDLKKATARVVFQDRDDVKSFDLQVMQKNTLNKKAYWMPEIDEIAVCLFLSNGQESGIIIGTLYAEDDASKHKPVPEISDDGKQRVGLWIDAHNYIKWIEEERKFEVKTENPIEWVVG